MPSFSVIDAHVHTFPTSQIGLQATAGTAFSGCAGTVQPPSLSDDEAVDVIRQFGVERVLFGSDWPWFHPLRDRERIEALPLSDSEKRLILGENARRVMGL